ncbi:MAG: carboxypeptidase regulatory-like domain-containing protein [Acidobacteriota bacterium]
MRSSEESRHLRPDRGKRCLSAFFLPYVLMICVYLNVAGVGLGQDTSTIQGHVADPAGASVPRALVTATNQETGVAKRTESSTEGYYRISDLLPGTYEVRVEAQGFKVSVRRGLNVFAQASLNVEFTLELGEVTESVEVLAEESQVETEVARISEVIPQRELEALPIQGRGILNMAVMSPGIVGKAEQGAYCCDAFSVYAAPGISSGGAENKSQYSLDGLSLRYTEGSDWAAVFSPNADAISEIRVSTHPYSAEYGRVSGPQVQMTTKSGTNEWHGTAHFTFQDKNLNARPFFSTEELPDTYSRYFGGTLGGSLVKDRLFVFGAYEGLRQRTFSSGTALTETPEFAALVQQTRPNSVSANLLKSYQPFRAPSRNFVDLVSPGPNGLWITDPDGIPDLGEVIDDRSRPRTGDQINTRVDYHSPNGNDRVFASYWYTTPRLVSPGLRLAFESPDSTKTHSGAVVYTRAFSPHALNELRFAMMRLRNDVGNSNLHVPGIWTDDGFSLGNFGWLAWQFVPRTVEISDTFSLNRGRHAYKFGFSVRSGKTFVSYQTVPEYGFASLAAFANDQPYYEARSMEIGTGAPARTQFPFLQKELAFFFQDNWQVSPRLTINYGIRWEDFFSVWMGEGRENWQPILNSSQLTPTALATVTNQRVDRYYNTDFNNFGPRVGFAWDPTGKQQVAVRGGFGVLYDEIHTQPLFDVGNNPPAIGYGVAGPDYGVPVVYGLAPVGTLDYPANPALTPGLDPNTGAVVGSQYGLAGFVSDMKVPMVLDGFVGAQYQIAGDLMIQMDYKHRRTTNDFYAVDFNRIQGDLLDGLVDRINPKFGGIQMLTNAGRRTYHGLILAGSKRFSQGWSLNASYTYSYGKTNAPGFATWPSRRFQTDPYNPDLEWARDDIPHAFTLHGMWDLPILRGKSGWLASTLGGWQLSTIWNLQAGNTFIPYSGNRYGDGGDFNADGFRKDRPDRPNASLPSSFSKQQWLDGALLASVFPLPDPATPRVGTLPNDLFRGPGYARVDLALSKSFPVTENRRVQFRVESFNLPNRLNISSVVNRLESPSFARATGAYQNRVIQMAVKFLF